MSGIKGDFVGFTFNGVHSSELGLTRVSDGNRYTENLFPVIQEKTVQVPGADGTYYFGSYFTQRPFNISVVFDDMTEEQLQKIKRLFGDKKVHDLIFDELPYKIYKVKSTGTPNLKYVCFNENMDSFDRDFNNEQFFKNKEQLYGVGARSPYGRIYKGEGQLNFVCYSPFARSRYKYIDEYNIFNVPEWGSMDDATANNVHYNLYDWASSVNLKSSLTGKEQNQINYQIDKVTNNGVMVYNPGDFPVHFNLYFLFSGNFNGCMLSSPLSKDFDGFLTLNPFSLKGTDIGVRLNGKLNLIEGIIEDPDSEKFNKVLVTANKNPMEEGWYVYENDQYVLTQDVIPQEGVVYYERKISYLPSGTIYNEYIEGGDFFKIPIVSDLTFLQISPLIGSSLSSFKGLIEYNYLFY